MQLDLPTVIAVCVGLAIGAAFAAFAGRLSARVFFDASGEEPREHH